MPIGSGTEYVDKAPGPDRLITPAEAASLFGVDPKSMRRWHLAGLVSARRTLGGQRRYWESEIRALAAEADQAVTA
jgi:predicted site-specific integrase-resolvase